MSMIYVTPASGARVRMPERNSVVMPKDGAWVLNSVHYANLLASGDVILADPQPSKSTAAASAPAHDKSARVPAKEK